MFQYKALLRKRKCQKYNLSDYYNRADKTALRVIILCCSYTITVILSVSFDLLYYKNGVKNINTQF